MASFISLLFLSLFYTTLSKVYVYSPQQLIEEVKKETGGHDGFEMSLANFGIIPYGHSLIGRIYYDTENADGCEPYGEFDFSGDPDDDKHPTPIILANRGNCTFVKKIRNIEHAGGRLGIVIDNTVEEAKNIIMSDDGSGMGITIPSFLISKKDGKILTDFLAKYGGTHVHRSKPNKQIKTNETEGDSSKNTTTSNEGRKDINGNLIEENDSKIVKQSALFVTFELPHPDQRVEYDIWYSSVDDRALDFMVEFREYDEKFSELVLMTPHFVSWSCEACDSKFKEDECFGNGKYCAIAHKRVKMSGKEIILEDLRQRCIYDKTYKNDRSVFWKYIKEVHENCPSYINADCSKTTHSKLGLDYGETLKCVSDSFVGGSFENSAAENRILESERKYWNDFGANFYPSIVINNRTYRGTFDPDAVFGSICAGFKELPDLCNPGKNRDGGVTATTILLVVLALILLNVILIYCYRRISQREMKENMRMHVNSAVSQYFALSQRERDTA